MKRYVWYMNRPEKITTYKKPPHRTEKNYTILSLARAPARSFFYTTEYISFVSSYSSRSNIPPKMWAQWSIIFLFILKFHSRLPFRTSVFLFLFFFILFFQTNWWFIKFIPIWFGRCLFRPESKKKCFP